VKTGALVLAIAAAMTISAAPSAGLRTTSPSAYILMSVLISDKGIKIGSYQASKHHGDMTPLGGPVPRGDFLSINVFNLGKKPHNFTVLGLKTPTIKPGGKAHLFTAAKTRGNFVYRSTLDKSKAFRGVLTVA
jgi:hypothetical protein